MAEYLIYGKHLKNWVDSKGKWHEPDSRFAALNAKGCRVSRLDQAMSYATKEDAQAVLDKPGTKLRIDNGEVCFDIRRA